MDCKAVVESTELPTQPIENTTVLVIEDDPIQVEFLTHGLSKQGFKVLSTTTCDGGMQLAKKEKPDVILLDVVLPDGDGLSVCQRLADEPATSKIPVIVVSGSDRQDIVWQSRTAGGQFFLKKPYDPNTLLLLIKNSLGESTGW